MNMQTKFLYLLLNLFLFSISAYLGFQSRLNNYFNIDNHAWIEHIFAGLGVPAFIILLFVVPTMIYNKTKNDYSVNPSYIYLSFVGSIGYVGVAILSEFFKETNIENQFIYDLAGTTIYFMSIILIFKRKKVYQHNL